MRRTQQKYIEDFLTGIEIRSVKVPEFCDFVGRGNRDLNAVAAALALCALAVVALVLALVLLTVL